MINPDEMLKGIMDNLSKLPIDGNLIEVFRHAPLGIKVYSVVYGHDVEFVGIKNSCPTFRNLCGTEFHVNFDGSQSLGGECLIYPTKDIRSWRGWQNVLFKQCIGKVIYHKSKAGGNFDGFYLIVDKLHAVDVHNRTIEINYCMDESRFANEDEEMKFFSYFCANGFIWNAAKKCIEKKKSFSIGDIIKPVGETYPIIIITDIDAGVYKCVNYEGDGIASYGVLVGKEDEWEIVSSREKHCVFKPIKFEEYFDFKTLEPFDEVLIRDAKNEVWKLDHFHNLTHDNIRLRFNGIVYKSRKYCIPFNDETKHLLNTKLDAPLKYKFDD